MDTKNPEYYILGNVRKNYNFASSKINTNPQKLNNYWNKCRKALKLPDTYKLYSLKDTGIIDLLDNGVSVEHIRQQADHHSLSMTSIYARHIRPNGSDQIRNKARNL